MPQQNDLSRDRAVTDVSSVREFVETYYKTSRLRGRGDDYAELVIKSHEQHLADYGWDLISRHESRTGEAVTYFGLDGGDHDQT